jgi:hypothetical protein
MHEERIIGLSDPIRWEHRMTIRAMGLLTGWKRSGSSTHIVLTLKIAENVDELENDRPGRVHVAVDDRQLCGLARDLARAARERGLDVWPTNGFFRRNLLRLTHYRPLYKPHDRAVIHALLSQPQPRFSVVSTDNSAREIA